MIKVLINDFELDLSSNGVNIIQKNNMFRDEITKDFSYPFNLILTPEIAVYFGILSIHNITNYKTKINVTVIEDNNYYKGYLKISKIIGKTATITLYYGHEILGVYNKFLNTLPFEKIEVNALVYFAENQVTKQWPDVSHNFVTIRDKAFSKNSNYSHFEGYLNNTNAGTFYSNNYVVEDGVSVAANKNVLVPMPYLMEVLRVGYELENKVIKGSFVDDIFNHKILFLPDNYLEQFSTSELDVFSFNLSDYNYVADGVIYSFYKKEHNTHNSGSYRYDVNFNLNKEKASYFKLTIKQGSTVLYSAFSENKEVNISEVITININADNNTETVTLELVLHEQLENLSSNNFLKFEYQETKLNVYPNNYSLSSFMPNITFRDFVNFIENFFNVDIDVQDNVVYLNYIDELLPTIIYDDKSKYEIEEPKRDVDLEKVFCIKLDDDSALYVDKNGIVSDVNAANSNSLISIDIPAIPLKVNRENDITTAENTSKTTTIKLCLYNGLVGSLPLAVESINGRSLSLNSLYLKWKYWLKFRTNSEVIEDTFFAHVSENFSLKKGMYKYNKKHLIKEIQKKSVNKEWNKITLKFESF